MFQHLKSSLSLICVIVLVISMTVSPIFASESVAGTDSISNYTEVAISKSEAISRINDFLESNANLISEDEISQTYRLSDIPSESITIDFRSSDMYTIRVTGNTTSDIITISNDGIMLNGSKVITVISKSKPKLRKASVRYANSSSPAISGPFTTYLTYEQCTDIWLKNNINSIGNAVLSTLLGIMIPAAGLAGIAITVIDAFTASNTSHLSCKDWVYTSSQYPSGWYGGQYSEQHRITWYAGKNFVGPSVKTVSYRNGYVI